MVIKKRYLNAVLLYTIIKEKYENFADIKAEVKKYNHFRNILIEYLEKNPIIQYTEFKNKAICYYYKNRCNFKVNKNTFKNIYYKYSISIYNKTMNGNYYLKECIYTNLYNKSGKK